MKTRFLGHAYQSRSPILGSQTAINIYPESVEGANDEVGAFYGCPGLTSVFAPGAAEVRGLFPAGGYLFAVIGSTVYRLNSAFSSTNLGTLPNSTGRVSMTDNGTQVAIAHQDGMHFVAFTGSAIASVANGPSGAVLAYQDNYGIFTVSGGSFGLTGLADLSSIDPLDIATAEGASDDLVSLVSDHREIWLLGERSTEIWTNTGAAFFPFERAPGGFIEQGCCAKWSPAKLDNSVFWLGRDAAGQGVIYRAQGYIPSRISTHAIEYALNEYSTIADAIGFSYQEEGHSFYYLTFPTAGATWVYDISTQGWHQRAYLDPTYGTLSRHRANCYATFNGKHYVGDYANGNIYQMSLDTYTDNGDPIYRERAWELPDNEFKRIRGDRLELICVTGDGDNSGGQPNLWLQVSYDAGRTFGYQRIVSLGAIGQTSARAIWRRLGTGRSLVYKVATTMANRVHWLGANFLGEALDQ